MAKELIQNVDQEALALATKLITSAKFGALGVIDPETGYPLVTRIALGVMNGALWTFISGLSAHSRAIKADPRISLLVGEPEDRGNALIYPRLSLQGDAVITGTSSRVELAEKWLNLHPKAKLYIGLGDFYFISFKLQSGALNGGFGKAYSFSWADLTKLNL